jgi:hypothetical protein
VRVTSGGASDSFLCVCVCVSGERTREMKKEEEEVTETHPHETLLIVAPCLLVLGGAGPGGKEFYCKNPSRLASARQEFESRGKFHPSCREGSPKL